MMLGTLSVTEQMASPDIEQLGNVSLALLFMIAAVLLGFNQRTALIPAVPDNHRTSKKLTYLSAVKTRSWLRYMITAIGVVALIAVSMLHVISRHQQLEATAVTTSMRVQAWVTIEGISDSVYHPVMGSGYRQVATLSHITPLTAGMSQSALDRFGFHDLSAQSDHIKRDAIRVLLQAYPPLSPPAKADNPTSDDDKLMVLNELQSGDQLLMHLTLAPLSASSALNNPSGFDSYRWLRARHLDGTATIIAAGTPDLIQPLPADSKLTRLRRHIDRWRLQLRQHFYQGWDKQSDADQQADAVTLSLLTGDRSLINRTTKDLYQLAGISHLLAISGTHVLFLAIMLAGLVVGLCNRYGPALYRYVPRWQVRWAVMVVTALIYALFTGFDVPAARTAWMLFAVGVVRLSLLPISTLRVLLALAIIMAWLDPYVLWQAGYWLSFIAVALLLQYDAKSSKMPVVSTDALVNSSTNPSTNAPPSGQLYQRGRMLITRVIKLQCWLFVALLPVTLLLFGKVSLWGLLINLFAIGLFGWVIVPMNLLAGLSYLVLPALADMIWNKVSAIVGAIHDLIKWLTAIPTMDAWLYTPMTLELLIIAVLILLPWVLPRGVISRMFAIPPLTLFVMTVYANQHKLQQAPTLYILPIQDQSISAILLTYPTHQQASSAHWLFLADHSAPDKKSRLKTTSADELAQVIQQHLRRLAVTHLDGVVVQSGTTQTGTLLLAQSATKLSHTFPLHHYWQAGQAVPQSSQPMLISVQSCEQGKSWHMEGGGLRIEALTGWHEIDDERLQSCSLAIDSDQPITVRHYNAANPYQSSSPAQQSIDAVDQGVMSPATSRLIVDAAIHPYSWKMQALLCAAVPSTISPVTWLGASASPVTPETLITQRVTTVMTYDNKPLVAALSLSAP